MSLQCQIVLSRTSYAAGQTPPPQASIVVTNPTSSAINVDGACMTIEVLNAGNRNAAAATPPTVPFGPGVTTLVPAGGSITLGPVSITGFSAANGNAAQMAQPPVAGTVMPYVFVGRDNAPKPATTYEVLPIVPAPWLVNGGYFVPVFPPAGYVPPDYNDPSEYEIDQFATTPGVNVAPTNLQPSQPLTETFLVGAMIHGSDTSINTANPAGLLVSYTGAPVTPTTAPPAGTQGGVLNCSFPNNLVTMYFAGVF